MTLCCALALTIAAVATSAPRSLLGEETALCLAALSLNLLFTPIAIAQEVPLTRQLRFGLLTAISVGQAATRGAVAVGFAASGFDAGAGVMLAVAVAAFAASIAVDQRLLVDQAHAALEDAFKFVGICAIGGFYGLALRDLPAEAARTRERRA